jgi:hypothetical protein
MSTDFQDLDDLLDQVDRGQFTVSSHCVAQRLLRALDMNDPLYDMVLRLHDDPSVSDRADVLNRLWEKIDTSQPGSDGWLRLAVVLATPDGIVDGHLADYLTLWAQHQGMSQKEIIAAFHCGS